MRMVIPILLILFTLPALAVPRVPSDDAEVLEKLAIKAGDRAARETRLARAALARDPQNFDIALRLAQLHLNRAKSESDPRQLGQAEAVLAPWWNNPNPPVPVLVLRATIRQTNHEFALAIADLQQALQVQPENAQAWLTLATVQQVIGELAEARASCARLMPLTSALIAATCAASVDGVNGQAAAAFDRLTQALAQATDAPVGIRTWALSLQADIAARLSRAADAERLYREALALDTDDAYSRIALADLLLDLARPNEVLKLIPADSRNDPMLLRHVLAARVANTANARQLTADMAARFAASQARGDRIHLREEARLVLAQGQDNSQALTVALENWKTQKEPPDARIVLEAALAANQPRAVNAVLAWLEQTKLEDARIAALAAQLRALG